MVADKGFVLIDGKGEESESCEFKHLGGGVAMRPCTGMFVGGGVLPWLIPPHLGAVLSATLTPYVHTVAHSSTSTNAIAYGSTWY